MSRLDFIKELARLLDDLPREEKIEILKYYNGYFDDAGEENEAAIIAELGSPEKVAAEVKAGMQEEWNSQGQSLGEQGSAEVETEDQVRNLAVGTIETESSKSNRNESENNESGNTYQYEQIHEQTPHKKANGWKTIAIIAILMITFPVWIGLLGGLIGLLGGAIGIAVSLIIGLISILIGLVAAGISCVITGITSLAVAPINGMLGLAVGIFLLGLMLMMGLLMGLLFGKLIPWIVSNVGKLVRWCGKSIGGLVDGVTGRR